MDEDNNLRAVWYASEQRARSVTRIIAYEDVGELRLEKSGFTFAGSKNHIVAPKMEKVTFGRQRIAWITFALCFPVGFPIVYGCWYLYNMLFGVSFLVVVLLWLVFSALGLLIGSSVKWVGVEHTDDNGGTVRSYFADGSGAGWGGIFGGNRRLLAAVSERVKR